MRHKNGQSTVPLETSKRSNKEGRDHHTRVGEERKSDVNIFTSLARTRQKKALVVEDHEHESLGRKNFFTEHEHRRRRRAGFETLPNIRPKRSMAR